MYQLAMMRAFRGKRRKGGWEDILDHAEAHDFVDIVQNAVTRGVVLLEV